MKDKIEELKKEKEKWKAYKRITANFTGDQKNELLQKINNGEKTGYATLDRPWDQYYKDIKKKDIFLNTTAYQGLVENNKDYPKDPALEYFGAKINFGELNKNIDIVAKSLKEYGVKKGDFVTICGTTSPEIIYLFYAISKVGAVANLMSPFFEPKDMMGRISDCDSKLVIVMDKFYPLFKTQLNGLKNSNVVVLPMMNASFLRHFTKKYKVDGKLNESSWNTFIKDGKYQSDFELDPYEEKKPLAMVYSSGTTGAAKGILLSNDSFQKLINAYGNSGYDTSRGGILYTNAPAWASTGISLGINFPLAYGVKVCVDPRFETDVFAKNILKFKPNYIMTSTGMYQSLTSLENLKLFENKSISYVKYPIFGGEKLSKEDVEKIEGFFSDHGSDSHLINGYGQCECGATITTDITTHIFSNEASGIPLPDITTIGIFDDEFNELKTNQRGNIYAKTDTGMISYHNNPEATKEYFHIDVNGDSWSTTGDIGYIKEDGSLVVLGRKNDYSIINDNKIYNFDVENSILNLKYVKLCEAQTLPNDSNKLVAHIVFEPFMKDKIDSGEIKLNDLLVNMQEETLNRTQDKNCVPSLFCIRDSFPVAKSGKRDTSYIKNNIDGLIDISNNEKSKKLLK